MRQGFLQDVESHISQIRYCTYKPIKVLLLTLCALALRVVVEESQDGLSFAEGGKQLIKAVGVLAYVSSAWIYCENNTRDRQQRDIRCRSICQHHWGPLTGHSVAALHPARAPG